MGIISVDVHHNQRFEGGLMLDERRRTEAGRGHADEGYIEFVSTGVTAVGAFHCSGCGYGVTVHAELPACPMCGGTTWEQAAWSPFSRAGREH
jgi:rubrerythrin